MAIEPLHIYPLTTSPSPVLIAQALQILRPHLPVSIALYRRLQFGQFLTDSSILLSNLSLSSSVPDTKTPWLLAFIDRARRPETELWLSCSWEKNPPSTSSLDSEQQHFHLLRRLLSTLRALPVPASIHTTATAGASLADPGADFSGLSRADYAAHAGNEAVVLAGSVHARTAGYLQTLDALNPEYARQGLVANHHFVFAVGEGGERMERAEKLPAGLRWGEVRQEGLGLVRARTQIPRQERTLAVLPSVAIFTQTGEGGQGNDDDGDDEGRMVGWAFVGLDGSLTTLHVEAEYRNKGLAKALTSKLFREKMGGFWEQGVEHWAHGIVIVGNVASTKMCRSLGGEILFDCYWLRVDLDRV
nr:hypothetical protein CFP56_72726 [Quercus suber]